MSNLLDTNPKALLWFNGIHNFLVVWLIREFVSGFLAANIGGTWNLMARTDLSMGVVLSLTYSSFWSRSPTATDLKTPKKCSEKISHRNVGWQYFAEGVCLL